jgi:hypothetical protein
VSGGMDRDPMARMQSDAAARCFDPRGSDYRTFRLTDADETLLDEVCKVRPWVYIRACGEGADYRVIRAAWAVIGERHGFDPTTATEHPEGGAQVLAKPPAKTGPVMRGG